MGNPVIQLAMEALRAEGFPVGEGCPGSKMPALKGPAAAISIHSTDWKKQTVTLSIYVLCPEALGAVYCQCEAFRVGEILTGVGARCSQGKSSYDGLSKTFCVEVRSEFTGSIRGEEFVSGPGFTVTLGETALPWAVSFRAELSREVEAQYEPGNTQPMSLVLGEQRWKVELRELLPPGIGETEAASGAFDLIVNRCGLVERFRDCRWSGEKREFSQQGLERIRTGICLGREVTSHG